MLQREAKGIAKWGGFRFSNLEKSGLNSYFSAESGWVIASFPRQHAVAIRGD